MANPGYRGLTYLSRVLLTWHEAAHAQNPLIPSSSKGCQQGPYYYRKITCVSDMRAKARHLNGNGY
ncbi:MAG: hypothetical protein JWO94_3026 [Verrucomicrobiaceae bacterium]|nr:hypothetical protein [Verrucomicrobiaceae bacterium]